MPGDHSELEPPLPIPNRTVKQLRADDSADSRVKVGHRQALMPQNPSASRLGGFVFGGLEALTDWENGMKSGETTGMRLANQ